jgi:hypothetical protein
VKHLVRLSRFSGGGLNRLDVGSEAYFAICLEVIV